MGTDLAKILEIDDHEQRLLVRAGVGWDIDIVGKTYLPLSEHSSETFAIKSGKPLITENFLEERRFQFPDS